MSARAEFTVGAVNVVRCTSWLDVTNGCCCRTSWMRSDELGALTARGDSFAVTPEQLGDARGCIESLICGFCYAIEEKLEPCFPRSAFADFLQEAIVVCAMRFEVEAEVEQRFA